MITAKAKSSVKVRWQLCDHGKRRASVKGAVAAESVVMANKKSEPVPSAVAAHSVISKQKRRICTRLRWLISVITASRRQYKI
jgi:hypothetical protein